MKDRHPSWGSRAGAFSPGPHSALWDSPRSSRQVVEAVDRKGVETEHVPSPKQGPHCDRPELGGRQEMAGG